MTERSLGRTGLRVSRLGLGLAAVGRPGYINLGRERDLPGERTPEALWTRSAELLDRAWAAGVRYFDVARSYGRAEEFLARWLDERGRPAGSCTIGSKWGYRYTASWRVEARRHEQKELTLERFREQLVESRSLLGDHLGLYQIHSATVEAGCLNDEPLLQALVEARREGHVRAIGLTTTGTEAAPVLAGAIRAEVRGEHVFDVVQATYNVLEPSLAAPLAEAHAAGLGVIVKEVHANGRLTATNPRPEDESLRDELSRRAAGLGLSVDQLALAFVLARPWVDVASSGAATAAQLESHLGAAERQDLAGPETLASLAGLDALAESPARYWSTRAALPWS
ncbi:MAG: aldo/keto reductase [Deltaproteobacteria bacterium]|nr:aldo/keto reductase [Deltaproteobacteria bacterium]